MKEQTYCITPQLSPEEANRWRPAMGVICWRGDELFFYAGATGLADAEAALCASYDGAPVIYVAEHEAVLVSETWARESYPERKAVYDAIHARAVKIREDDAQGKIP